MSADLDDVHQLLGRRPRSWEEAKSSSSSSYCPTMVVETPNWSSCSTVGCSELHAVRTIRIVDHAAPRGRTADPLNPKSDPRQARPEPGVGRRANKDGFLVQRNCGPYRFLSTPEVQKWTDLVQMIQSEHETNRDLVIAAASVEAHGEGSWAVRSLTRRGAELQLNTGFLSYGHCPRCSEWPEAHHPNARAVWVPCPCTLTIRRASRAGGLRYRPVRCH